LRLKTLKIERYGCFEDTTLNFTTEPGRINLVLAPNGAGKSVLRHAFHDLLFDIPLRSPMKFRFGNYKGMALRAAAVASDGAAFDFAWIRDGKPQRVTSDPARYAKLRAESTPRQLEQLFALDTARLRQGGTDLKGGDTLADALLSGTGELAGPRKVRAEIEARAKANWTANARQPPLNAALGAVAEARKQVKAAILPPAERERQERALEAEQASLDRAREAQKAAQAEMRRLHRIALVRPHLLALEAAEAWLAAHLGVLLLPAGLEVELAAARVAMAQAEANLNAAVAGEAAAAARAAEIVRDAAAMLQGRRLERLSEDLGKAEEAARDIVDVRARRAAARARVAEGLRAVGRDVPEDDGESLLPPVALLTKARAAIHRHAELAAARNAEAVGLRAAAAQVSAGERAPAAGQAAGDHAADGLAELLDEIRADRNPVQHLAEATKALYAAEAEVLAALALVPGWSADADALRALTLPGEAALERLASALADAHEAARRDEAAADKISAARAAAQTRLGELRAVALPDAAAIKAARARRDRGWQLIHRRAFSAEGPDAAEEAAFCGEEPLPLAFDRSLREADDLADRRIAELDRVSEAERLAAEVARLDGEWSAAVVKVAAARETMAARSSAWAAAVSPLGMEVAATMVDVRRFLAARQAVVTALKVAEPARRAAAAVQAQHAAWAERLAALLGESQADGLSALLARADARLKAAAALQKATLVWETNRKRDLQAQRDRTESLAEADRALDAWSTGWAEILALLGRPAGETPDETAAVLARTEEIERDRREAHGFGERIAGMQENIDRFSAEISALAAALDEPPGADVFAAARRMTARWERAKQTDGLAKEAADILESRRTVLAEAQRGAAAAADQGRAVVAAAGARDLDDAANRIAESAEHTRHAALRDGALAGLAEHGAGLTRAALQAEAASVQGDAMDDAREAADAAMKSANTQVEAAILALNERQTALQAGEDPAPAANALANLAAASANFSRLLEEQLVLRVALEMLDGAMSAVQAETGDGGVDRLSRQFAAVTDGAYGVMLDEEDGATLYAVEHRYPNERKALSELSEGTRDQLYLALRMLALRDHAAVAAPLPFIADDILQTFDDARTVAALRALVELSADVQVIVLTHHAHVAELGATLGDCVRRQGLLF
jgi:uncharacterized protein YhaN